ncbi:MAG: nucleotidyl transferase AbiEii/AbiGii toxin family protein [Chitinophagaceae bacterium]
MRFSINEVKVDFVLYPFEWLQPFEVIDATRLISLRDIIPMKLQAISNRFSKKDFWDIAFLLDNFTLEQMLAIFKTKFPQIDTGFIIHSLTAFDGALPEQDPVCLIPKSWEEIKQALEKAVINYTNQFLQ